MRVVLVLAMAVSLLACGDRDDSDDNQPAQTQPADAAASPASSPWRVVAVQDASNDSIPGDAASHVIFASGDTLVIPLTHLKIIATLQADDATWIVASGVECTECDAPEMVAFVPAARGPTAMPLHAYAYPGEQIAAGMEDGAPFARSRMFLGACAVNAGRGGVVVEERPDSAGVWTKLVRTIVLNPVFADSVLPWSAAVDERVAEAVRRGDCEEVPGKKQYVV